MEETAGPLAGLRVIEFTSIGPGPHCGMLLSDLGADVLRIDRAGGNGWPNPIVDRGRAAIEVDIRSDHGRAYCHQAAELADVVIEGFRPGVMERLGLGPDDLFALNPRLIYGRITGWGQEGPLAQTAGHDINYIALTGALAAMGKAEEPASVPLNLVGDFGGGSMLLTLGILAALFERERSGKGQVVDAAIVDGVHSLMTFFAGLATTEQISLARDENILAGAAPFYRTYVCGDGKEVAVGPLEDKFYQALIEQLGLPQYAGCQYDQAKWPDMTAAFAATFLQASRDEWVSRFEGSDACVAPVLSLDEAPSHPHNFARAAFQVIDGIAHASPAPRFSRSKASIRSDGDAETMLARWRRATPPDKS